MDETLQAIGFQTDEASAFGAAMRWVVEFNRYFDFRADEVLRVEEWVQNNLMPETVVMPYPGKVWCQSEADATLLYMAFR